MRLPVDAHGPLAANGPAEHVIEGGGVPRGQARPSIREMAGGLDSNPNPAGRAIEDLKQSGYRPLRPCPEAP